MEKYVGLDVHKASCTLVVLDARGKKLSERVVDTNGQTLVAALTGIAGTKHLCFEEGTHSSWLFEILQPHVDRIAVVHTAERRRSKSDSKDAHDLAERMRTDALGTTVFKDPTAFATLRQLVKAHQNVVRDTTRCANRLHALFRSRAIALDDVHWKRPSSRDALFAALPISSRSAAETLFAAYDAMSEVREIAEADVTHELKKFPTAKLLATCPGLGPIRTAQLLATVITPGRFRSTRQFWSYCGLGIVTHSSADWVRDKKGDWARAKTEQTRGLNKHKNGTLKAVFKGAATTVILSKQTPLKAYYERLCKAGTKPNLAKVSLARKIAAIVLAMWKQGKEYAPNLPETTRLRKAPPEGHAQDRRLVECNVRTPEPKPRFGREHP